jgi:hypothetical protein
MDERGKIEKQSRCEVFMDPRKGRAAGGPTDPDD